MTHLYEVLENLTKLNEKLGADRNAYLRKEAQRKHFESCLIQDAAGKSNAEKLINAQATAEWLEFHLFLATLEAVYEFRKLQFSILDKEYQTRYLETKLNDGLIGKQL
jgi:hypothetical protein